MMHSTRTAIDSTLILSPTLGLGALFSNRQLHREWDSLEINSICEYILNHLNVSFYLPIPFNMLLAALCCTSNMDGSMELEHVHCELTLLGKYDDEIHSTSGINKFGC